MKVVPSAPVVLLLTSCLAACLTGCTSISTLRADAESVFRQHNRVSSETMLVLADMDHEDEHADPLIDADAAMMVACEALNDLAIAHRDAQRVPLRQRIRLSRTIEACRVATADTQRQLELLSRSR